VNSASAKIVKDNAMKRENGGKPAGRGAALGARGYVAETSRPRVLPASLIGLVLLLTMAAWGQTEPTSADRLPAQHVLDVAVEVGGEEDRVEISVDGMIEPKVFPHQGPENPMVIVDIPGTATLVGKTKIPVDSPLLERVRIGQHANPTKVRVVLDLLNSVAYDVVKLDLYLGDPEHPDETPTRLVLTLRQAPPSSP